MTEPNADSERLCPGSDRLMDGDHCPVCGMWQGIRIYVLPHHRDDLMNATVTVTLNDRSVTFELDGDELSRAGGHHYLSNASRAHVADAVERALLQLTRP